MFVRECCILPILRRSDCRGGIVGLRISDVLMVTFSRGMVLFIARVDQALVADEEVAAGKRLGTDVAYKWFLLGVSSNMSLEMLLRAILAHNARRVLDATVEVAGGETYKSCEESLAVRAWKGLGLVARLLSLDPT